MSEPRDTLDLDRAFADLTRDVTGATTARGAGEAVRVARRRRAATGGVAAAAAVAAVSLGLALLPGDRGGDGDVAAPDTGAVEPAELTPAALSSATRPWVDGWRVRPSPVLTDAPCLSAGSAEPRADENEELRAGPVGASRVYSRWDGAAQAADVGDAISAGFASCEDGDMPLLTSVEVPGAEVSAYAYPDGARPDGVVWLAVAGDRLALLTVAGIGDPPEDVVEEVGRALVAGLTYDEDDEGD